MEQAQAATLRLAETTAQRISNLFSLYRSGRLSLAEFKARSAAVISAANTAGVQIADIAVAAEATRQLGRSVGLAGLEPTSIQTNAERIGRDIDRVIAADPDVTDLADSRDSRLRQLARSEPLLSTATATHTAMTHHEATGWVRVLDADPCKVCRGWADGVVRSVGTSMARHNGCGCIQQPVF